MSILKDRCMERMIAHNLRDQLAQLAKLKERNDLIVKLDGMLAERRKKQSEVTVDRRK